MNNPLNDRILPAVNACERIAAMKRLEMLVDRSILTATNLQKRLPPTDWYSSIFNKLGP
jgi:hypothetical protein